MAPATCFVMMATAADPIYVTEEEKEIWDDEEVLRLLQTYTYGNALSAKTRNHIHRRARNYRRGLMADILFKLVQRGAPVVMPRPSERTQIAPDTHWGMDYFGVQRVLDRLQKSYWWRGIGDTVVAVVEAWLPYARVKARFRESGKELQPLPIRGLGFRWR